MEENGREVKRRISREEGEKSDLIESLPRIIRSRKLKSTTQISCEPKLDRAQARLSLGIQLWGRTIGTVCGNLLQSCGLAGTQVEGKISEEHSGGHAKNRSTGSSRKSTWRERRQKRHEDQSANWRKGNLALGKERIKHSEQYQAPWSMTNTMKETKKLSSYTGW